VLQDSILQWEAVLDLRRYKLKLING